MAETRSSPSPPRASDHYKPRCIYCGRKFSQYDDLYTHTLEDHHIRLSEGHICWRCDRVCKTEGGLWRHMALAHYKLRRRTVHMPRTDSELWNWDEEPPTAQSVKPEISTQPQPLIDLSDGASEVKQDSTKVEEETTCPVCHIALRREDGLQHINAHQWEMGEAIGRMRNFGAKLTVMKLVWEMQGLDD